MRVIQNRLFAFAVAIASVLCAANADGQDYQVIWRTIDGGGGYSEGGNFKLDGTIGQHDAGQAMTGGGFSFSGGFWTEKIILGDVNGDGVVNLLDVAEFVEAISSGEYIPEADVNEDGAVDLLDVGPFVELLGG